MLKTLCGLNHLIITLTQIIKSSQQQPYKFTHGIKKKHGTKKNKIKRIS